MVKNSTSVKTLLQAVVALMALYWAAGAEAQTTGRFASLAYDQTLLQATARFGALNRTFRGIGVGVSQVVRGRAR